MPGVEPFDDDIADKMTHRRGVRPVRQGDAEPFVIALRLGDERVKALRHNLAAQDVAADRHE